MLLVVSPFLWRSSPSRPAASPSRVRERLTQAGLARVSPMTVVVVSLLVAIVAAAVTFAVLGVVALAVAAALVGLAVPWLMVSWRARARRKATRVVWPDIVDQLVSAARSGLALPDGVVALAHAGPEATRTAFATFEADYRSTGNFSLSLDGLKAALADPVADRIIETLRMSREVGGGELTTVLRNLSVYLRQENAIRSEVEARQSWVMNAARLGVAAPWIVLLLLSTRPEASVAYNSSAGTVLIVAGLVLSVVAYRLMVRLGRLPEERRWFA